MDTVKIILFEFLFGFILQGFAFVLGIFAFNRQKVVLQKYLTVSAILIVISYLLRLLPISFGVHTLLNLLLLFLLSITLLKMPIYISIRSTLIVTVLLLATEMANVALMIGIFGQAEFGRLMMVPSQKAILGLPGGFAFAFLILLSYLLLTKSKMRKRDSDGKTGE